MSYEGYLGSSIDHGDIWLIYDKEHIYEGWEYHDLGFGQSRMILNPR